MAYRKLRSEEFRKLVSGKGVPFDAGVLSLTEDLSFNMMRQMIDDVEREQREKDQAQQNSDSGSTVPG